MNDRLLKSDVREALDDCLSGAMNRPSMRREIMKKAKGEIKMKRKAPMGLVLAVLLMLLAVGAAAAVLLSGREIVENYALPMAEETEGEAYTMEQTMELVALAEENGIILSENAKHSIDGFLAQGEGYYKEEVIMAIAKAEFGENPAAWTLEQQNWFDDMCVAIGFIPEKEKALPAGGDTARERAIQTAEDYIHATYDAEVNLRDSTLYKETMCQYINGDVDGEYPGMYWSIWFEPQDSVAALFEAKYSVYLNDDGEILGDHVRAGIGENSSVSDVRVRFFEVYGREPGEWSQETLRAYRTTLLAAQEDGFAGIHRCMELTTYPDIAQEAISKEKAMETARAALAVGEETEATALYLGDEPNPVWRVLVYTEPVHSVEVDSLTAEVKNIHSFEGEGAITWWDFFLQRVREQVEQEENEWLEADSVG